MDDISTSGHETPKGAIKAFFRKSLTSGPIFTIGIAFTQELDRFVSPKLPTDQNRF
jgi:hypothetical protein